MRPEGVLWPVVLAHALAEDDARATVSRSHPRAAPPPAPAEESDAKATPAEGSGLSRSLAAEPGEQRGGGGMGSQVVVIVPTEIARSSSGVHGSTPRIVTAVNDDELCCYAMSECKGNKHSDSTSREFGVLSLRSRALMNAGALLLCWSRLHRSRLEVVSKSWLARQQLLLLTASSEKVLFYLGPCLRMTERCFLVRPTRATIGRFTTICARIGRFRCSARHDC